ncbi:TPA: hypothetical protein N0F65_004216 [Lagenidium giganteum]|uniref:G-protein coupled receptors family 2 profile 2 domain-containing protein n=1 Tax=Lagenidium giganteum TaxID=4803 RepID=A0AAV2Z9K5_9STRA|nr:TPA: hypothetical protein N0F65_004216 [Lagenidium giganteum]
MEASNATTADMMASIRSGSSALEVAEEVLLIISASISFAGCTFIFTTWKNFTAPNYLSRRIVASIGLAGLFTAFGFFMSVIVNGLGENYRRQESLCYVQALTLQYFYLASYLWTGCFAFHLYQIFIIRNEYPEKFLWMYRVVGWGVPGFGVAFLVLRQLTGHVGVGGADRRWCWITVHRSDDVDAWDSTGALQQFLLFYLPILCVFVFNATIYVLIVRFLAADPMAERFKQKVLLYLVVYFLCSMWGCINRLIQAIRKDHQPCKVITLLECICDPLQPLLNAVVYGMNKQSLNAYKERFCSAWLYASLPSSDEEESGLDDDSEGDGGHHSKNLVDSGDFERGDGYYLSREIRRKLTYPLPIEEDYAVSDLKTALLHPERERVAM